MPTTRKKYQIKMLEFVAIIGFTEFYTILVGQE